MPRRLTLKLLAESLVALQERVDTLEAAQQAPNVLSSAIGFEMSASRDADLESYDPPLP